MKDEEFNQLLRKPANERRKITETEIEVLAVIDLNKQMWTPGKLSNSLELMQIALRKLRDKKDE